MTVGIIEYIAITMVIKTILKKMAGNVSVITFNSGEGLTKTTAPFDTFIQIIDGLAEIVISGVPNSLRSGQSIVIPAHAPFYVTPNGRFKMIQTILNS